MHRPERMADTLREEITEIVGYELEDPRVQSATVTDVRVSDDLRNANVYVLVRGNEEEIKEALLALNRAATFVRQKVALSMNLRYAPQLHFGRDTVEENASKVNSMLGELDIEAEPDESIEEIVE